MMVTDAISAVQRPRIKTSRLVLPAEHGSWSFLFEPLIAGLAIAFSPAAPWIALAAVAAFFARQPLRATLISKGNHAVTVPARKLFAVFAAAAAIGLLGAYYTAGPQILIPFFLALPLAASQFFLDLSRKGRSLWAEILGAVAISSTISIFLIADGKPFVFAASFWLIFAGRFVPSLLYVRNRLFLEKGKEYSFAVPAAAHAAGLVVLAALAFADVASILTVLMFGFLLCRSVLGLSKYRRNVKAMKIGVMEVLYGALTLASMIIGYYAGF
jgi:hypothetical protein